MPESPFSPRPTGCHWKEISDLPQNVDSLRDRELESLWEVWNSDDSRLDDERMKALNARIAREWAIETGIIENVYTLDRGITQTLISRGINASYIPHDASNLDPELVARIIQSRADALDGLFAFIRGDRVLSTGYIKELHAALLRHQETIDAVDQFGKRLPARSRSCTPLLRASWFAGFIGSTDRRKVGRQPFSCSPSFPYSLAPPAFCSASNGPGIRRPIELGIRT